MGNSESTAAPAARAAGGGGSTQPPPAAPPPRPEDIAAAAAVQVSPEVLPFAVWPVKDASAHPLVPTYEEGGELQVFPNSLTLTNTAADGAVRFAISSLRPYTAVPNSGTIPAGGAVTVLLRPGERFAQRIVEAVEYAEDGGVLIEGEAAGGVQVSVWSLDLASDAATTQTPQQQGSTVPAAGGAAAGSGAAGVSPGPPRSGAPLAPVQCRFARPRLPFATALGQTTDPMIQVGLGGVYDAEAMPANRGEAKWAGAVCGADSSFYCVPASASRVLKATPGPRLVDMREARRELATHIAQLSQSGFFKGCGARGSDGHTERVAEAIKIIRNGAWLRAAIQNHVRRVIEEQGPAGGGQAGEKDPAEEELRVGQILAGFEADVIARHAKRVALTYLPDDPRRGAEGADDSPDAVTTELIGPDLGNAPSKWHGGALAPDGRIFFAPSAARRVLCFNPVDETAVEVGAPCAEGDSWVGAVEWEGKLLCIPHTATRFLEIDPEAVSDDGGVSCVGPEIGSAGVDGRWAGGVQVRGAVFLIPDTATRVLKFDLATKTFTAIGDELPAVPQQFGLGAKGRDGCIYCPPRAGERVLKIDPIKGTAELVGPSLTDLAPGPDKWRDAVPCYWGGVLFVPFDAPSIAILDIKTGEVALAPHPAVSGAHKYCSGVENLATGAVYCIPYDAPQLVGVHAAVTTDGQSRTVVLSLPDPTPTPAPDKAGAARAAAAAAAAPGPFMVRDRATDVLTPPPYWRITNLQAQVKVVDVTKEMLRRVQALMDATCNSATLGTGRDLKKDSGPYTKLRAVKVSRIESPDVWRLYAAQRETMLSQLRRHKVEEVAVHSKAAWMQPECDPKVNEVYLWHGTKPELLKTIQTNGFDERVGALSGMYGAGVYFADKCSKSDQYCTPTSNVLSANRFCLLLSRVLLGSPFHTQKSLPNTRRPPDMKAQKGRPHDSIIATLPKKYREFIVYSKTQTYPEFLIEYVRE